MKKLFRNGQHGFTLIELLVVISILGVLAAVAVPNVAQFMKAGDLTAAQTEAASMQTAVDGYMATHGGVAPTQSQLVSDGAFRGGLKGTYTISSSGTIAGTSGWSGLTWDAGNNTWTK